MFIKNDKSYNNKELNKIKYADDNSDIEDVNNIINFISNNCNKLIDNNLYDFLKEENYNNMGTNSKNKIFCFSSFINSCKAYTNISDLKRDFKEILNSKIEDFDYYYNIIYNYLNDILEIILDKQFFKEDKNHSEILEITKQFTKCFQFKNNNYYPMKEKIFNSEFQILKILKEYYIFPKIFETIDIINDNIKQLMENIKLNNQNIVNKYKYFENEKDINNNEINLHFDSYKINKSINSQNNNYNDSDSSLNNAFIGEEEEEGNIDFSNNINNQINNIKYNDNDNDNGNDKYEFSNNKNNWKETQKKEKYYKRKKEHKKDSYNYENLMCPPIKSDDSD